MNSLKNIISEKLIINKNVTNNSNDELVDEFSLFIKEYLDKKYKLSDSDYTILLEDDKKTLCITVMFIRKLVDSKKIINKYGEKFDFGDIFSELQIKIRKSEYRTLIAQSYCDYHTRSFVFELYLFESKNTISEKLHINKFTKLNFFDFAETVDHICNNPEELLSFNPDVFNDIIINFISGVIKKSDKLYIWKLSNQDDSSAQFIIDYRKMNNIDTSTYNVLTENTTINSIDVFALILLDKKTGDKEIYVMRKGDNEFYFIKDEIE